MEENYYNYYSASEPVLREDRTYDVVVVGCGGFGSASLYWASRNGFSALGIEQFEIGHHRGSSQDHSRIIRLAYSESRYTKLMPYAYMAWSSIEDDSGIQLYYKTGGLVFGDSSIHHLEDFAKAMSEQGIPFEDLSASEAMKRWPQLTLQPTDRVLYQPDAGIVDPRKCNAAHITLAYRKYGAHLLSKTKVIRIDPKSKEEKDNNNKNLNRIVTDKHGTIYCKSIILAAGAWSNDLLKWFGIHLPLTVYKEQVTYYDTPYIRDFSPSRFPIWIGYKVTKRTTSLQYNGEHIIEAYGFPVYGEVATKAGFHRGGQSIPHASEGRQFGVDTQARDGLEEFLLQYMPTFIGVSKDSKTEDVSNGEKGREISRLYTKTCLYEWANDEGLVVSQLPGFEDVTVAVGSGHGYKWASFIGLVMSQLATEGKSKYDVSSFRIDLPKYGMSFLPLTKKSNTTTSSRL